MNHAFTSVLSGLAGIALLASSALSAAFAGLEATVTIINISAFVLWGIIAIGLSEYMPSRRRHATVNSSAAAKRTVRVPSLVEYPALACCRRVA